MTYEIAFGALAHPMRQDILAMLQVSPRSVRELTDRLDATQPGVSQHLKVLREAGLVRAEAAGVKRVYHIEPERLAALRDFLTEQWAASLAKLGHPDA